MNSTQRVGLKQKTTRRRRGSRWETLTDWARGWGTAVLRPLAYLVARTGVHPNTITLLGMVLQVGVGVVFGLGYLPLGGLLLLIISPLDALDGLLARTVGKQSRFGAFLDSTLDRVSDAALLLGLAVHYARQGAYLEVGLLVVSLVAAMMVSYIRARAEALGLCCRVGLLTRMERIVLIALIGLLSAVGVHTVVIGVLAVFSVFTVVQRIVYVYRISREREEDGP